jgi:hypothetical protein
VRSSPFPSLPQPQLQRFHWTVRKLDGLTNLVVQLNPFRTWSYSVPVFLDGFETGDASGWSAACPPACD